MLPLGRMPGFILGIGSKWRFQFIEDFLGLADLLMYVLHIANKAYFLGGKQPDPLIPFHQGLHLPYAQVVLVQVPFPLLVRLFFGSVFFAGLDLVQLGELLECLGVCVIQGFTEVRPHFFCRFPVQLFELHFGSFPVPDQFFLKFHLDDGGGGHFPDQLTVAFLLAFFLEALEDVLALRHFPFEEELVALVLLLLHEELGEIITILPDLINSQFVAR